jgi:hypothetical protein
MVCYRDMTFCSAGDHCKSANICFRFFSKEVSIKADMWAIQMGMLDKEDGTPAPWVAWADFSERCEAYEPC